jgi:hypothetical protein
MSQRKRQILWFVALYATSLIAYAAVVGAEKGMLHLLH